MMRERAENGDPYVFVRPVGSVTGAHATINLPPHGRKPDWELELGVVIARASFGLDRKTALESVAGYLVANDLTLRDHIFRSDMKALGTDWLAGKCAPGFLPLGPLFVPAAFVPDPHALRIELRLNGQTMRDETTDTMVFDIPRQLEWVSKHARLLPGDVLCTGSPSGNGAHYGRFLQPGDVVEGTITGLGTQRLTFS